MIYRSKKDPTITASLDFENEKYKTVNMIYLTGPNKGKAFSISHSTLNLWWEENPLDEKKCKSILDDIDMEKVNTPYPEPKFQAYIPVPQSVIEYESSKRRKQNREICMFEKPSDYEEFADLLAERNIRMKKVNKEYISLPDNSKLKLQAAGIALLASQTIGEMFINKGCQCKSCPEKGTPFRFDFKTQEDFDMMLEVLSNVSY